MLNAQWVISFGRPGRAPEVGPSGRSETADLVETRRRQSRQMFAATRSLLAEARAVLDAVPVHELVGRHSSR